MVDIIGHQEISGAEALAWGVVEAGVQLVTGHPGSPGSAVVDELLQLGQPHLRIEWAVNERSAFDAAFGASLASMRALVCFKSVGLNVALDSIMVSNLAGGDGGFVVLTGDDPGGWGSQNEQDSRPIIAAAEIPLIEPSTPAEGRQVMSRAFQLSERFKTPVALRVTYAMSKDLEQIQRPLFPPASVPTAQFMRQEDRWTVTPAFVVRYHQKLLDNLKLVRSEFETWDINRSEGEGRLGIIAPGYSYQKLKDVLNKSPLRHVRILKLGTLYPLPEEVISHFLSDLQEVLIIEETAPFIESQIPAIAYRAGLNLQIHGRASGHIPETGELFAQHISNALSQYMPDWIVPEQLDTHSRHMISSDPLCEGCPYIPGFGTLLEVMNHLGGREAFIVTGESGCMIRAQVSPEKILDTKFAMGSSIGLAAGLARTGIPQKVIALAGDTAFLHTGWSELIDAVQSGVRLLVVLLDNATAAISGGQPHAAVRRDLHGNPRKPVDLVAMLAAAGVERIQIVDPQDTRATRLAYEEGLSADGVSVVIIRRPCPIFAADMIQEYTT